MRRAVSLKRFQAPLDSCAPMRGRRTVSVLALLFLLLSACQTGERPSIAAASNAYRAAEYGRTISIARDVAARSEGLERSRARYLEGIALLALGRASEAVAPLEAAVDAPDRRLAADARVSLGTAQIELDQFGRAADAYRRAASLLEGAERERALSIETALRACVRGVTGSTHVSEPVPASVLTPATVTRSDTQPAASLAKPSSPTAVIVNGMEIEPLRFAIQAGAFRERSRAESLARELGPRVSVERLSSPRVFEKTRPDGGVVYVVQFGNFENRAIAGKALLSFARSGYTVERALGP